MIDGTTKYLACVPSVTGTLSNSNRIEHPWCVSLFYVKSLEMCCKDSRHSCTSMWFYDFKIFQDKKRLKATTLARNSRRIQTLRTKYWDRHPWVQHLQRVYEPPARTMYEATCALFDNADSVVLVLSGNGSGGDIRGSNYYGWAERQLKDAGYEVRYQLNNTQTHHARSFDSLSHAPCAFLC